MAHVTYRGGVMKKGLWRPLAFLLLLGAVVFGFRQVQPAHAVSSPSFYPVGFKSYDGYPCPSSITVNGQGINLGSNCSAMNNTVAFIDPTLQSDPSGWGVVIGPNWTQKCRDGSVKSLGSYTWSGTLPGHNNAPNPVFMHTFPSVCPGYAPTNFYLMLLSRPYGDSWEYIGNMYIPG
jgi:hypothetical protein